MDAYIGAVSRFGARLGRPIGRGSQVGHQPLFSRLQMGRKPVQRPVRFLRRLIEKQMPDHLHLLRGAELPPDDRQDEGFLLFQVIILGDAGQNDRAETRGFRAVFGDRVGRLPVTSIKSMIGHCLGASGGIEAAIAALTVARGIIPPTVHHDRRDPE